MMIESIGVIGVGEIAHAIVDGLCDGTDAAPQVFLSPRGARIGAELSRRYLNVRVCADNQGVLDAAAVVIIAVRPQDRAEVLAPLDVSPQTTVISVMAGVGMDEVRDLLGHAGPVVRAIPLPAVRQRSSITVTYPAHPVATTLFHRLGGVLVAPEEDVFDVFSALTATLTSHYWYLATLTGWAARQGVEGKDADRYVRGLFQNVAHALADESRTLPQIAASHETPGGTNERIRTIWFDANSAALQDALDALLADLKKRRR